MTRGESPIQLEVGLSRMEIALCPRHCYLANCRIQQKNLLFLSANFIYSQLVREEGVAAICLMFISN